MFALLPVAIVADNAEGFAGNVVAVAEDDAAEWIREPKRQMPTEPAADRFSGLVRVQRETERAQQVRIEQRVIIRISPGPVSRAGAPVARDPRRGLVAAFAERQAARVIERRMGQCVAVGGIEAVQPDGPSRLLLFMRDQRIVSAALEKGCNARDYYSGFLIERTSDGMICAARDKLLSRTGANCAMNKLRQLIVVDPDE